MLAIGVDGSVFAIENGVFERIKPDGTNEYQYDALCTFAGVQPGADGSADLFGRGCDVFKTVGIISVPAMGPGAFFWRSGLALHVSLPSYGPGGALYFSGVSDTDGTQNLFALVGDLKQGWSSVWSVPTDYVSDSFDGGLAWPIVRDDGSVVFADNNGLHAVSPGGTPLWDVSVAREIDALAADANGTVYAGSPTGVLIAVSADGKTASQRGSGNAPAARPIVDGDGVVYAGAPGGIVAIASDGTELWQTSAAATPLAIDATGTLYALDTSGKILSALR
jgi:hypothetical protein